MRKNLLILLALAFAPRFARAQEVAAPVVAEKVTYSREIPKGLRAFVPRGGKSRFWGATKLKYNGQQVWVHVYDVRRARFDDSPGTVPQKSAFDLFVFSKTHKLRRINSNRFSYPRFGDSKTGSDPEFVGVNVFWLDPQTKKRPIIEVDITDNSGDYGGSTQHIIGVFSSDLKKSIIESRFANSGSNSGDYVTEYSTDENGLLAIFYYSNDVGGSLRTTYKWMNNHFMPVEKQFKDWSEGAQYQPRPLTQP